jgi:hypothetical protein
VVAIDARACPVAAAGFIVAAGMCDKAANVCDAAATVPVVAAEVDEASAIVSAVAVVVAAPRSFTGCYELPPPGGDAITALIVMLRYSEASASLVRERRSFASTLRMTAAPIRSRGRCSW